MKIDYFRKATALITTGMLLLSVPFQALAVESAEEARTDGQTVQEADFAIEEETAAPEQTSTDTEDPEEVTVEGEEDAVAPEIPPETEGLCGETLSWRYEDGKLYIEGTGEMYDYDSVVMPSWNAYSDVASELYIDRTVTLIDLDAFSGLNYLEKVFFEGNLSEWRSVYFTGSKENFGEEITADEIFAGAEICFMIEEDNEEGNELVDVEDVEEIETVDQDDNEGVPSEVLPEEEQGAEELPTDEYTDSASVETGTEKQDATAAAPVITAHPADVEASVGEQVVLTVQATGTGLTYQWQWSTDNNTWKNCSSAGAKTNTFSFAMKEVLAGRYYRCVVTSGDVSSNSRGALISLAAEGLKITSQTGDVSAVVGEAVSLHVEVNSSDVEYQWQWSADGNSWKNCTSAGAQTDTFKFTMKESLVGRYYRCMVDSDSDEVVSSNIRISLAQDTLEITLQPDDVSANEGEAVSFHVEVNKPDAAYQWQWSADGKTWKNCTSAGAKTDTFRFTMKGTLAGRYYRCVVSADGSSVESSAALVSLAVAGLEITLQPDDVSANEGETVSFHVEVSKPDVAYQWQWSADGKTWKNCTSAGAKTNTFSFTMKGYIAGRYYRCIVSADGSSVESSAALVSLAEAVLEITEQPQAVSAIEGQIISFHVEANRSDATYQWQWSADGKTWKNCTSTGAKTDTFSFTMKGFIVGRYYRCVVSADGSSVESSGALVSLAETVLEITEQPQDVGAEVGEAVSLHVATNRNDATYQWQWSADGNTWKNCTSAGSTTDTFGFIMKEYLNGRYYRCVVSAGNEKVESEGAHITLAVKETVIDGVVYKVVDGKMTVTGYRGTEETVTVQEIVDGQTVTVIGESAFENNTNLKQIDLPDTIQVISKRAFAGCTNLTTMN